MTWTFGRIQSCFDCSIVVAGQTHTRKSITRVDDKLESKWAGRGALGIGGGGTNSAEHNPQMTRTKRASDKQASNPSLPRQDCVCLIEPKFIQPEHNKTSLTILQRKASKFWDNIFIGPVFLVSESHLYKSSPKPGQRCSTERKTDCNGGWNAKQPGKSVSGVVCFAAPTLAWSVHLLLIPDYPWRFHVTISGEMLINPVIGKNTEKTETWNLAPIKRTEKQTKSIAMIIMSHVTIITTLKGLTQSVETMNRIQPPPIWQCHHICVYTNTCTQHSPKKTGMSSNKILAISINESCDFFSRTQTLVMNSVRSQSTKLAHLCVCLCIIND